MQHKQDPSQLKKQRFTRIACILMAVALPFIMLASLPSVHAVLYEDQAGLFDWGRKYIGPVKYAKFDGSDGSSIERVFVGTELGIVASLEAETGRINWRQVLPDHESMDGLVLSRNSLLSLSDDGKRVRKWDKLNGVLIWEQITVSSLQASKISKENASNFKTIIQEGSVVYIISRGHITALDLSNGNIKWRVEQPSLFILEAFLMPRGQIASIVLLGSDNSGKLNTAFIKCADGSILESKSFDLPVSEKSEFALMSGGHLVVLSTSSVVHSLNFETSNVEILAQTSETGSFAQSSLAQASALNLYSPTLLVVSLSSDEHVVITSEESNLIVSKRIHGAYVFTQSATPDQKYILAVNPSQDSPVLIRTAESETSIITYGNGYRNTAHLVMPRTLNSPLPQGKYFWRAFASSLTASYFEEDFVMKKLDIEDKVHNVRSKLKRQENEGKVDKAVLENLASHMLDISPTFILQVTPESRLECYKIFGQQGGLIWAREEALAQVSYSEYVELPPIRRVAETLDSEFGHSGGFMSRITTQSKEFISWLAALPGKFAAFPEKIASFMPGLPIQSSSSSSATATTTTRSRDPNEADFIARVTKTADKNPFPSKFDKLLIEPVQYLINKLRKEEVLNFGRDQFGIHQIIVVFTDCGSIFGLDNLTGEILWKMLLQVSGHSDRVLPQPGKSLFLLRSSLHHPLPPAMAAVGFAKGIYGGTSNETYVFTFNPVTGISFSKPFGTTESVDSDVDAGASKYSGEVDEDQISSTSSNKNAQQGDIFAKATSLDGQYKFGFLTDQVVLLPIRGEEELYILSVVESSSNRAHIIPSTPTALSAISKANAQQPIHFYLVNRDTNALSGQMLSSFSSSTPSEYIQLTSTWSIALASSSERIVSIASRATYEKINSVGRVLGNRNVLYKYLNPNLLAIASTGVNVAASSEKTIPQITIYVVDTVVGSIIFQTTHTHAKDPVHIVQCENWIVYHYWNTESRRFEMSVLEMFVEDFQENETTFSSFKYQTPTVMRQAFVFPTSVSAMHVTTTVGGITNKQILVGLPHGWVFAIDKFLLDPRRPLSTLSEEDKEEGLMPYNPEIPLNPTKVPNYNQTIPRIRGIQTGPAALESVSLVFSFGVDLFSSRVHPSKMFDMLNEDFSYGLLIFTIVFLTAATFISRHLLRQKRLNKAWK